MISVILADRSDDQLDDIALWCSTLCEYTIRRRDFDVSDHSYEHDTLHIYDFKRENDATMFMIRWGGEITTFL